MIRRELLDQVAGTAENGDGTRVEQDRRTCPSVYWYLSFRCNLACKHCWVNASPQVDTSGDLSTEQAMEVVEQLAELNAKSVSLSGGEALLRRDTMSIIEALASHGIRVSLETNGMVFTENFVRRARALQEKGLLGIGISLDGGTAQAHESMRGESSFGRTMRGLQLLQEHGIQFVIQAVLNRLNYRTIPQLYEIAQSLRPGITAVAFAILNPLGRGDELAQDSGLRREDLYSICELIKQYKSRFDGLTYIKIPPAVFPPRYLHLLGEDDVKLFITCQFPLLGILPNGDVSICALTREEGELHLGNVHTHRLREIWQRESIDRLRDQYLAAEDLTGVCGDCVWRTSCKGSCRAWAYEDGASFDAPHPVCHALEESGAFPDLYRVSARQASLAAAGAALRRTRARQGDLAAGREG